MPEPTEFSRPLPLAAIGATSRRERLEAAAHERAALAARFGIPAVERLEAELTFAPEPDGAVRVTGVLRAGVVQTCVVTLDPVPQPVEEAVALRLLPPGREPQDGPDDPLDEIAAEPDGTVDLGEVLAQQLSLALDPYPRAPGAVLPEVARAPTAPFAALTTLRPRRLAPDGA